MIVYLANKTQFRAELHGKGAQASCLFLEDEQATDPTATGRMPMLLSNLFVAGVETRHFYLDLVSYRIAVPATSPWLVHRTYPGIVCSRK